MQLAPIVLFVYNRPRHTEQTLNALIQNDLADQSVLYIYADGAKENATKDELKKIDLVRQLVRKKKWCKKVYIIEAEKNKGLADSIVDGVTEVINQYGKIIVLEDDIVTSRGFLKYMNNALEIYENESKAFHISGYMFPVNEKLPETFFYKQTSCWGWGTWKNKWDQLQKSPVLLKNELNDSGKVSMADIDGTNQFVQQLNDNVDGKLKTWAVLWHFSVFLKDGLSLHPGKSLVRNIGHDSSGSNSSTTNFFDVRMTDYINVKKIPVTDFLPVYKYLKNYYRGVRDSNRISIGKQKLKAIIPSQFKEKLHMIMKTNHGREIYELKRISSMPRFTPSYTDLLNKKVSFVDNASFLFMKKEIFEHQIYKFNTSKKNPYIIDCGANIGLSVIFFKQLFPESSIIAFEPDDKIFSVLKHNIGLFDFSDVELLKKACWNKDATINFFSEGADGGSAIPRAEVKNLIGVPAISIREYLKKEVDFLKIDIEGAETEVLTDIKDLLFNVRNIFVEYHSFLKKEQMLAEILGILKSSGFRLHVTAPGLASPSPFVHLYTHNGMDNQLNIYGFRE